MKIDPVNIKIKFKRLKFTIQLFEPTREQSLAVSCPYCKSSTGVPCMRGWNSKTKMSGFHLDRQAKVFDLEIVSSGAIYMLPGGRMVP